MGIISWIILGLIAGATARWLLPGSDEMGFFRTVLLGIAGAFVGGFVGTLLGLGTVGVLSIGSILIATGGAFLLLFVYRLIKQKGGGTGAH